MQQFLVHFYLYFARRPRPNPTKTLTLRVTIRLTSNLLGDLRSDGAVARLRRLFRWCFSKKRPADDLAIRQWCCTIFFARWCSRAQSNAGGGGMPWWCSGSKTAHQLYTIPKLGRWGVTAGGLVDGRAVQWWEVGWGAIGGFWVQ